MTEPSEDNGFKTKLRRIILVSDEGNAHEWDEMLLGFAAEVTHLSMQSYAGLDLLALPTACVVVDGRAGDQFTREYIVSHNSSYYPLRPVLWLADGDDVETIQALSNDTYGPVVVRPYNAGTVKTEFSVFAAAVLKVDWDDLTNFEAPLGQYRSLRMNVIDMICEDPGRVEELRALRFGDVALVVGMMTPEPQERQQRILGLVDRATSPKPH